jgi:hypothetical protein
MPLPVGARTLKERGAESCAMRRVCRDESKVTHVWGREVCRESTCEDATEKRWGVREGVP